LSKKGKLFLIPVPIAETSYSTIPEYVLEQMHGIEFFIVERARTSRRYIKASGFDGDIGSLHFTELDKRNPDKLPDLLFDPIFDGKDMGLMSEAGMPGIADPGALVVAKAHELDIEVVPMIGPSSIFLSLAASGLNGQQFTFHGYLPVKNPQLNQKLLQLDKKVQNTGETQIFIETPYRNESIFQAILKGCHQKSKLCIASEITGRMEYIQSKTIAQWKKSKKPELHKKTAVFLLGK